MLKLEKINPIPICFIGIVLIFAKIRNEVDFPIWEVNKIISLVLSEMAFV